MYGAFLVDPTTPSNYRYTKDYVIVLSDWINTNPSQVLANLKKDGDYYAPRFPLQPSLSKFIHDYHKAPKEERPKLLDDYKMMQQMRMSIYDLNDVAYDTFLLNGHSPKSPWTAQVKVGDIVRLRFIGAGANTIFRVKIPETTLQMVHAQGNDVTPYTLKDFTIAPGETYDVLVKIKKDKPYIIYAESRDTVGTALGALMTNSHQVINYQQITPFPEPLPVTREMMDFMMGGVKQASLPIHEKKRSMHSMSKHMKNVIKNPSMHMVKNVHKMKMNGAKGMLHASTVNEDTMHSMHMPTSTNQMQNMNKTHSKVQQEALPQHGKKSTSMSKHGNMKHVMKHLSIPMTKNEHEMVMNGAMTMQHSSSKKLSNASMSNEPMMHPVHMPTSTKQMQDMNKAHSKVQPDALPQHTKKNTSISKHGNMVGYKDH